MTDRFVTAQPGITTWHAFSAGPHYDPARLAFGPVVGCDEHLLEPGAGFDRHAHRGVVIVSIVLDGALRHVGSNGDDRVVRPGGMLVQATGDGIRHEERNASDTAPLRFVQITILAEDGPATWEADLPGEVAGARFDLRLDGARRPGEFVVALDATVSGARAFLALSVVGAA